MLPPGVQRIKEYAVQVEQANGNLDNFKESTVLLTHNKIILNTEFLSNAMIEVIEYKNKVHVLRAILDFGSQ